MNTAADQWAALAASSGPKTKQPKVVQWSYDTTGAICDAYFRRGHHYGRVDCQSEHAAMLDAAYRRGRLHGALAVGAGVIGLWWWAWWLGRRR